MGTMLPRTMECSVCNKTKTAKAWYKNKTCGPCYVRLKRRENPEMVHRWERAYITSHREKLRVKWRRQYKNNTEKKRASMRAYRKKHLQELQEYDRERWKKPERQERMRVWRQENIEHCREIDRQEYYRNKYKHIARVNGRRAHLGKATPKWSDLNKIAEIYANCPPGYHVDHIIPLKGKNISGLHVPENLQYLPAKENLKKRNKWQQ